MAMEVTGRRFAPSPPAVAAILGGLALAALVARALEPAHVWVWTKTPPGTR